MKLERTHKPLGKKRELIKAWVERLRNPNSRQVQSQLKNGRGYCCLGHLCVVAGEKFKRSKYGHYEIGGEQAYLPTSVSEKIGFSDDSDPEVRIGPYTFELSVLNDTHCLSLREIADVIEADWLNGKPLKSHPKIKN
jgi:hypothetical protein